MSPFQIKTASIILLGAGLLQFMMILAMGLNTLRTPTAETIAIFLVSTPILLFFGYTITQTSRKIWILCARSS